MSDQVQQNAESAPSEAAAPAPEVSSESITVTATPVSGKQAQSPTGALPRLEMRSFLRFCVYSYSWILGCFVVLDLLFRLFGDGGYSALELAMLLGTVAGSIHFAVKEYQVKLKSFVGIATCFLLVTLYRQSCVLVQYDVTAVGFPLMVLRVPVVFAMWMPIRWAIRWVFTR
jgi:hypothetical protein